MDVSKAYNTINHKLLLKKLQAYGFDEKSLSITILLTENKEINPLRWQFTLIEKKYSMKQK